MGEGEGGVDGDRKVVSEDHGQSTTTRDTWKGPQLVARLCQVDTLNYSRRREFSSMSLSKTIKLYVDTFIFHEFHNLCTFLFGPK